MTATEAYKMRSPCPGCSCELEPMPLRVAVNVLRARISWARKQERSS